MRLPGGRKAIVAIIPIGLAIGLAVGYTQIAQGGAPVKVPEPSPGQHGPMLALESRVINLEAGGAYRYAKIAVTVELRPESAGFYSLTGDGRATAEKEAITAHEAQVPLLLDALGRVVSSKTSDQVIASDGREKLRAELLTAMRSAIGDGDAILDIYFTDLVMQ